MPDASAHAHETGAEVVVGVHQGGGRPGRLRHLDRPAGPVLCPVEVGNQHQALRAEAERHRQLRARPVLLEALDGQDVLALRLIRIAEQPDVASEPDPRAGGRTVVAGRLVEAHRVLLDLRRPLGLAQQVDLLGGGLEHLPSKVRLVDRCVGGGHEPVECLARGVQGVGALAGEAQVATRPLAVIAVLVVAGQLVNALLTAVLLEPPADTAVHLAPGAGEQAPVRDLVDQGVTEHERSIGRGRLRWPG